MCNGKHVSKSDITGYDNGIGFSLIDIWQIHVKIELYSKKKKHTVTLKVHSFKQNGAVIQI